LDLVSLVIPRLIPRSTQSTDSALYMGSADNSQAREGDRLIVSGELL